jgi:hypothetical protein
MMFGSLAYHSQDKCPFLSLPLGLCFWQGEQWTGSPRAVFFAPLVGMTPNMSYIFLVRMIVAIYRVYSVMWQHISYVNRKKFFV